jgi:sugar O-acyltransferase (sialic acid O-acetyltransferase NeuD family)
MAEDIVIVGAGAHARVVFDILRAAGRDKNVKAFIDLEGKAAAEGATINGVAIVNGLEAMAQMVQGGGFTAILGHGNNSKRKAVLPEIEKMGVELGTAVHPSAIISPDVTIGGGTTVSAGVIILTGARIGRGVIINTAATIDHDCVIDDFVQLAPGAHLAGRVHVQAEAFVGIGAVVIQNLTVGQGSVIGAGAAVVNDAPSQSLIIGVPARVRKHL